MHARPIVAHKWAGMPSQWSVPITTLTVTVSYPYKCLGSNTHQIKQLIKQEVQDKTACTLGQKSLRKR